MEGTSLPRFQMNPAGNTPPMNFPGEMPGPGEAGPSSISVPLVPQKRKPGRPKGSGKKKSTDDQAGASDAPKVKRPVGRPRKDGLPAGTPGPKRPRGRPRKDGSTAVSAAPPAPQMQSAPVYQMGTFPPYQGTPWPAYMQATSISFAARKTDLPTPTPAELIPSPSDWFTQYRQSPSNFLTTLLAAIAAPNPIAQNGPQVEEAFKSHLVSLNPAVQQSPRPSAPLYAIMKTFWLPSSPSYFSLTASASTRTPSEHRFFYWDPLPLVFNGIACPDCGNPLTGQGRIHSGPMKIYDIERPFWIIGCEYTCFNQQCPGSQKRYASTDASILRSLPTGLKNELRVILIGGDRGVGDNVWNWSAGGVSSGLWDLVRGLLKAGVGKDKILEIIKGIQNGMGDDDTWNNTPTMDWHQDRPQGGEGGNANAPGDSSGTGGGGGGGGHFGHHHDAGGDEADDDADADAEMPSDQQEQQERHQDMNEQHHQQQQQQQQPTTHSQASTRTLASSQPISTPPQVVYGYPPRPTPIGLPFPYRQFPFMHTMAQQPPYPPHLQQGSPAMSPSLAHGSGNATPSHPASPALPNTNGGISTDASSSGGSHIMVRPVTIKRPLSIVSTGGDDLNNATAKRVRHCSHCGSLDCKGKGGRAFCHNPCQDCGKLECKGRNSKRPDKTCAEAWA